MRFRQRFVTSPIALGLILVFAGSASAGPTDAAKCEADKLKRAGLHAKCLLLAESKLAKTEGGCSLTPYACFSDAECPGNIVLAGSETCDKDLTKYNSFVTKCDTKLADKFAKAETKWGMECPTAGDAGTIQTRVRDDTDDLAVVLSGGVLESCGDGTINGGEQCDGADLGGATCDSLVADTSGTLGCTPECQYDVTDCAGAFCGDGVADTGESCDGLDLNGETCASLGYTAGPGLACTVECKLDSSGCEPGLNVPARFRDNGDGTATDIVSGLMWEIQDDSGGIHDKDTLYTWCDSILASCLDSSGPFDGTAKTAFLDVLNDVAGGGASCFAGYCDWRLASILELRSLLPIEQTCTASPCVDPSFPGKTAPDLTWSSSTVASIPGAAWFVDFSFGNTDFDIKGSDWHVRAVRGGL